MGRKTPVLKESPVFANSNTCVSDWTKEQTLSASIQGWKTYLIFEFIWEVYKWWEEQREAKSA